MAWPPVPDVVFQNDVSPGIVSPAAVRRNITILSSGANWDNYPSLGSSASAYDLTTRVGQRFKNHKTLLDAGEILVSDYAVEEFSALSVTRSGTNVQVAGPYRFTDVYEGICLPSSRYTSILNDCRAMAGGSIDTSKTSAYAGIKEAEFELGVFIAESRESLQTLIQKYDKVIHIVRKNIPKRQSQKDWSQQLADAWLRMRYGVEPLLRDMAALLELHVPPYKARKRFYGVDANETSFTKLYTDSVVGDGRFSLESRFRGSVQTGFKTTVWVDYESDDPLSRAMQAYGLTNPLGVLWEVTRLSFVIDWLIDIGSFIQAYSISGGGNVIAESLVQKTVVLGALDTAFLAPNEQSGFFPIFTGNPTAVSYKKILRGAVTPSLPPLPSFNVRMNLTNVVDSLAIIRQMIQLKP